MSDLISKRELYRKIAETYNSGCLSWGANEIFKDIIGECDSVENKGDLISRQAVLDRTVNRNSIWNKITDSEGNNLEDILNSFPSAENKGDLIRQAEDYENEIEGLQIRLDIAEYDKERLREEVTSLEAKLSSAEIKGEWKMPIQDDGMSDPIYYQVRCSKCGFDLDPQTWHQELHQYGADNFCPNCGADMRGET